MADQQMMSIEGVVLGSQHALEGRPELSAIKYTRRAVELYVVADSH